MNRSQAQVRTQVVRVKCLSQRIELNRGAKIRKRPVIKTELWPHIIANEDDGDEVTSEDIGMPDSSLASLLS